MDNALDDTNRFMSSPTAVVPCWILLPARRVDPGLAKRGRPLRTLFFAWWPEIPRRT